MKANLNKKKFYYVFITAIVLLMAVLIPATQSTVLAAGYTYNADAAVAYAIEHANDKPQYNANCANFVSSCLLQGGLNISRQIGTGPLLREVGRAAGIDWHGEPLTTDSNGYVTRDLNPGKLTAGDVCFCWCTECPGYQGEKGICPHVVICTGFDDQGRAKYCSHTAAVKDKAVAYTSGKHSCGHRLTMRVLHISAQEGSPMTSGYERVIPDGDYIISSAAHMDLTNHFYLDIDGAGNETGGSNVQVWSALADDIPTCDVWSVSYKDGFYRIRQKDTNLDLDVSGASKMSGSNVIVFPDNGQRWAVSANGKNGYRIQSQLSGFSLTAQGNVNPGTNVTISTGNDSANQSWLFIPYKPAQPVANGKYVLLSCIANGWSLDVLGNTGDIPNGTNVQLWEDAEGISKWNSFQITKLSNGYYSVRHVASGKSLDVEGWLPDYGTNISLYDYNGTLNQEWSIRKTATGYALISRHSGMCLDVLGAQLSNGTNVIQYPFHGERNQSWKLVNAEYKITYNANGGKGAPAAATKYYKHDFVLSNTVPTRANYKFLGWSTSKTATKAEYKPGETIKVNRNVTLYAVWRLAAPKGAKAVSASATSIKVSWDAVSGATGYQVLRATSANGKYTAVGSVTGTSRVCKGLKTGSTYYFKVRAYKVIDGKRVYGSYCSVVSAVPKPAKPGNVKATVSSATKVKVSWKSVSGATGYEVYRATSANGTYTKLGTVKTTSRACPGLTTGTTYYFKVRAYKVVDGVKVYSAYSSVVSATPKK